MCRRMSIGLLVLTGLAVLVPAAATHAAKKFTVTSTLHGKQVLPHRIPWVARPSGSTSEVKFFVDGKVRWIEHKAPFSYSDDGGYLVTSWLSPGRHRFTVKATSTTGAKASETVVARVLAAPEPPADLAGTWQRNVPSVVPADPACAPDPVPAGVYTMTFDRRWIETVNPGKFDPVLSQQTFAGYIIDSDWIPGPQTFEVAGSVTVNLIRDEDPRGGWWCHPWGPKARYSWSVAGDVLTLIPVRGDPIHQRAAVFTGAWTRVR